MKYLGEYYHTRLGAKIALKLWQQKTYKEIEKRGDKVLKDTSHIYKQLVWTKPKKTKNTDVLYSSNQTNITKWFIFHGIWTQHMIDDIKNMKPIDYQDELSKLVGE